jgi:hypothetical protein
MCWDPLIVSVNGDPVLAARNYRVQVSKGDPNFSPVNIIENQDTYQSCWTPKRGYDDGTYYWHVKMIDGLGREGAYSDAAVFTKQYMVTTLISPSSGSIVDTTPTFEWEPVDGAARYRLQVSQFPTFSTIYETIDTYNTRYTPARIYDFPNTYHWRVAIIDDDGKVGPYNTATIIVDPTGYTNKVFMPVSIHE